MFTLPFFSIGLILGVVPGLLYGLYGGDEEFCKFHPKYTAFLHQLHHWQIGLAIFALSIILQNPFIEGVGVSMFSEDAIFHVYAYYFKRKIEEVKLPEESLKI